MKHPSVDQSKCTGCGACFKVCPVKPRVMEIVEMEGEGKKALIVHPEVCDFGGACVEACLTGAFQLIKKQFGVVRYSSRDIEHLTYSRTLVCSVAVMNRSATDRLLKSVLDFDQLLLETSSG